MSFLLLSAHFGYLFFAGFPNKHDNELTEKLHPGHTFP